jgi:glycosyltransferase involved in cell wall biosynthesis
MRILFVYGNMYSWGGIQTLLVRLAPTLRAHGHDVSLLARPRGGQSDVTSAVIDQIASSADVQIADDNWLTARRALRRVELVPADVIVACDLRALLLAAVLQEQRMPATTIVAAAFAPREYCWRRSPLLRPWSRHLSRRIVRQLPVENLMFATDGMARQTGDCAGRDLRTSPVLPLAIDTHRLRPPAVREVDRRKIVSVARLVPYYTHHRLMVHVIRQLRDAGHDFAYHAYGDGDDRASLEAEARKLGVGDSVVFHGSVPYERFAEVVMDAFAYIGMGTALIEAAACGVPALVAIDMSSRPNTYGFVQDTEGNDLGGYVQGHPEQPIAERLLWLASLDEEGYRRAGAASRRRAEEFDTSVLVPRLVDILTAAKPVSLRLSWWDRQMAWIERIGSAALWKLGVDTSTTRRHLVAHEC